jgi:hypothetical protein
MSVDKAFREMIRNEVDSQVKPLRDLIARLEAATADLDSLRNVTEQLAPLAGLFGGAPATRGGAVAKKAAARPAARPAPAPAAAAGKKRGAARKGGAAAAGGARTCAIIGCGKPSRTKGYCAAHYQKLRMLEKTNRRPPTWVDYAEANSVEDIKLPRGRAAAKALAEAAQKSVG